MARRHFLPLPRLALRSLPVVAVVVLTKLVLVQANAHLLQPSPLLSGIVAGTVFLLGFLLAGTVSDYKESERIPTDFAASLETIADELLLAGAAAEIATLREIALAVVSWIHRRQPIDHVLTTIRSLNDTFAALPTSVQPGFVVRIKTEQAGLRRMVLRVATIRDTSFVAAGYTITELIGALLVLALLVTDIGPLPESLLFTGMIALLLTYMFLLIRDLDDPFRYDHGQEGSADVSLEPLHAVARRLERLSGTGPVSPIRPAARGRSAR